jgi:hypothetical protein
MYRHIVQHLERLQRNVRRWHTISQPLGCAVAFQRSYPVPGDGGGTWLLDKLLPQAVRGGFVAGMGRLL